MSSVKVQGRTNQGCLSPRLLSSRNGGVIVHIEAHATAAGNESVFADRSGGSNILIRIERRSNLFDIELTKEQAEELHYLMSEALGKGDE